MWRSAGAALCGVVLVAGCSSGSGDRFADSAPDPSRTGAVAQVTEAEREGQHAESIEEMLRGRVPGLHVTTQPNGDLSLRVRGMDSLEAGSREPLVIIDGMAVPEGEVSRSLRMLTPSQVDRVQVLRDVSSTSVYGIRGANGVVLITTKRD